MNLAMREAVEEVEEKHLGVETRDMVEEAMAGRVTVWPDFAKIKTSFRFFDVLFIIWQNFEPTFGKCFMLFGKFSWLQMAQFEQISSYLVTL